MVIKVKGARGRKRKEKEEAKRATEFGFGAILPPKHRNVVYLVQHLRSGGSHWH
jgi:hypothetical protein